MTDEYLNELKEALCSELLKRILSGSASSSDIANAIRFLKESCAFPDKAPLPQQSLSISALPNDEDIKAILGEDY